MRRNGDFAESQCNVSFGNEGYSPGLAIQMLREERASPTRALAARPLPLLAWSALVASLLAAAVGVLGLLYIRALGRSAMRSRDALLRAFSSGRKGLPWLIMGSGFFLMAAMIACLSFETLNWLRQSGGHSNSDVKMITLGTILVLVLIFMAFALLWDMYKASRRVFTPKPFAVSGMRITQGEVPALWAFVREVADKAGVVMPGQIVAGLDDSFFVTENPLRLRDGEPLPPGCTLYLPIPYLAFMERAEAAAVIGHELAHFSGADTQYSQQFAAIYASAVNNLAALEETAIRGRGGWNWTNRPACLLVEFFLDTFHHAVRHWSRERERVADRVGASAASARAIGLSLLRIGVLAPRVAAVLEQQGRGHTQGSILGQIIAQVREHGLGDPRARLNDEQPHPTDTHPTTRQRLAALGVPEDAALFAEAARTQCSTLLAELGLENPAAG